MVRRLILGALGAAVAAAVFVPLPVFPFDVIDTSILIINADDTRDEDAIVASGSGRVDGRIDGDLVIATGDLTIDGTVTGDVLVLSHGRVRIGGMVGGSVRGVVRDMEVSGIIQDDLAVVAGSVDVTGSVGRDLLAVAGSLEVGGGVGRDVKGRMFEMGLDGAVVGDVDVTVRSLDLGPETDVGGDLLYRADRDAAVADGVEVGGVMTRLSTRGNFLVRLYLTLANALGFVLFVIVGFLAIWVFRVSSARAAGAVVNQPGKTLLVGLGAGVVLPFAAFFAIVLAGSVLAAITVGTLLLLVGLVALTLGPVPSLTAFGDRLIRGRGGFFGGFLVGAVVWRVAAWVIPFVGAIAALAFYVWGVGGWLVSGWDDRKRSLNVGLLGADFRHRAESDVEDDWEPPLPP